MTQENWDHCCDMLNSETCKNEGLDLQASKQVKNTQLLQEEASRRLHRLCLAVSDHAGSLWLLEVNDGLLISVQPDEVHFT